VLLERSLPRKYAIGLPLAMLWTNFFPVTYGTFLASNTATDSLARPLAVFTPPGVKWKRKVGIVSTKLLPVILNSKEEIGWKVQPQNSNLRQEIV
jgi:hypothetical protein